MLQYFIIIIYFFLFSFAAYSVHIKVRMPEVARKHKLHKPSQHNHHKYHHLPHHYYHNLHKPYYQPQLHAQYPNQAAKHGRRAVRPTPSTPPIMSHNHHEMGAYGDELTAGGISEHLLYTPGAFDLKPNYGPALFGSGGGEGSNSANMQQDGMLTMPDETQQLVQHMELMSALAAAAAAAAATAGTSREEEDENSDSGATETNTSLSDDFLADLQRTYANGKYPTTSLRRKKKYRGAGLSEIGDAAAAFRLNSAPQQQHRQQLQLMRQQYQQQLKQQQNQQQQFYGANYFMQQAKPQVQMLRAPPVISSNNNYNKYHQHKHNKNKQHYNNNDIYTTATSAEDNDTDADEVEDTNDGDSVGDDDHDNHDHDYDFDDDATLFFSSRPPTTTALSPSSTAYNSANDYDDDVQQFDYNSHKNNYFDGIEGDVKIGVNPVSYQPTTAYGAYAVIPSTPATATQHKIRPYRQSQQQQHRYTATQAFGILGHQQLQSQQQQLITTAQPINVVGPTASDFDVRQTPPTQPQQQQHHKYPVSPRYKKRKNRIKRKLNRNRILTQ